MVDLEKVRIFYYVALEGSLLKASNVLGLSSPSISKHVADLETKLNVKLFVRKRRGLQLTDAGESLYKVAKYAVKDLEDVAEQITNAEKARPNILRIITTNGFTCIWLINKLKKFIELNQNLIIKIYTSDENVDFLDSKADVGILPKVKDEAGVTVRHLKTLSGKLYASKEYLQKRGTPTSIAELSKHRMVNFYHDTIGHRGNVDWFLNMGNQRLTPMLTVSNGFGLVDAARCGYGIAPSMPDFPYLQSADLVEVLPEICKVKINLSFFTRAEQLDNETIKQLYDCLSENEE